MPDLKLRQGEVRISELLRIPQRYLRSIHLERDFNDAAALSDYVVTRPMAEAFERVIGGLSADSGRRAWRVTGDYGSGKSSFALVLAHLLRDPGSPVVESILRTFDREITGSTPRLVPVLVTGAREGIVRSVARAVVATIRRLELKVGGGRRGPKALMSLASAAEDAAERNDPQVLVDTLTGLATYAAGANHGGVLLVIDELGKLLEYAALHPERTDVYVLQQLAEAASRSGDRPLVLVGLLHQGFSAYAERLPVSVRNEWEKVAGRFEEIVFDQPLAHTAALVSGALHVRSDEMPAAVKKEAASIAARCAATNWFGRSDLLDPVATYPLHPTVLPVLVSFFARYGQHERSLFSFLLSSEPFGLQWFAERPSRTGEWYRIPEFYDYVRASYGHQLAGGSHRSHWSRILGLMDGLRDADTSEMRVLKTIAVLNLLDAEHLLATDAFIEIGIGPGGVVAALDQLQRKGVVFKRGAAGGYCLWPNTSANLEAAYAAAERALGRTEDVARHIRPYLDHSPLVARRHYVEKGTLRHFEVRYVFPAEVEHSPEIDTEADGLVVVALCNTREDRLLAEGHATSPGMAARADLIVAVPSALAGLAAELDEVRRWTWVEQNTPELSNDPYATAEVRRQVAWARRALSSKLSQWLSLRGGRGSSEVTWTRAGAGIEVPAHRGLLAVVSAICDALYPEAPLVRNELINRRIPSSAAVGARTRLIERMFTAADKPGLGMDAAKAPPERLLYLSVLEAGRLHRVVDGVHAITIPAEDDDPLRLRPALLRLLEELENADGLRVAVPRLTAILEDRPYGVRSGVTLLLVAVLAVAHAHEIAIYENGTFLRSFGSPEFLRLTKVPTAFDFQLCRVAGVRMEVFERLVEVFAADRARGRSAELLDVVTPLCLYVAQLSEYTRRSTHLPAPAARVRDVLLSSREPGTLLFRDLPVACGIAPFTSEVAPDAHSVQAFITALREALDELKAAYPQLLQRIRGVIAQMLQDSAGALDRAQLQERAAQATLAAREPRIRTFCLRLADAGLIDDDRWTEALGAFVLSKPPARWTGADEARCSDELSMLASTFLRLESIAAVMHEGDDPTQAGRAVRIGVTAADGKELARVVRFSEDKFGSINEAAGLLMKALPADRSIRLAALVRVLEDELEQAVPSKSGADELDCAVRSRR